MSSSLLKHMLCKQLAANISMANFSCPHKSKHLLKYKKKLLVYFVSVIFDFEHTVVLRTAPIVCQTPTLLCSMVPQWLHYMCFVISYYKYHQKMESLNWVGEGNSTVRQYDSQCLETVCLDH